MARKRLDEMTQDERLHCLQRLLRWLLERAAQGDPKARLALSQLPEVLERVRENRRLGRVPVRRGVKSEEVSDE